MKLSRWAKQQGISYRTAWRWVKEGKMPFPIIRTPSGSIIVDVEGASKFSTSVVNETTKTSAMLDVVTQELLKLVDSLDDPETKKKFLLDIYKVLVQRSNEQLRVGVNYLND